MNNVIILLTHVWNDDVKELYNKLSNCHNTLILFDEKSSYLEQINKESDIKQYIRLFNEESLKKTTLTQYYPMPKYKLIPEGELMFNNYAAIMTIQDELLNYDYIYIWEYDVRFNGDYQLFFDVLDNMKEDAIFPKLFKYYNTTTDSWFPNFDAGNFYKTLGKENTMLDIPKEYWFSGFMPFVRFSKKAFKMLVRELPKYPEYFEILIPTLCSFYYLKMTNDIKINDEQVVIDNLFSWMPYKEPMSLKNKLYHAIK